MASPYVEQTIVFLTDIQLFPILFATIVLFVLMLMTWWIYRSISDENLFTVLGKSALAERLSAGGKFLYALRYIVMFPFYTFLAFCFFALALFVLVRPETIEAQNSILFVAIVLVCTIRVAAYINNGLAEDLAKLVPLSMLVAVITRPDLNSLGLDFTSISAFFSLIPGFAKYFFVTVILELCLRFGAWIAGHAGFDPASDISADADKK